MFRKKSQSEEPAAPQPAQLQYMAVNGRYGVNEYEMVAVANASTGAGGGGGTGLQQTVEVGFLITE